MTSAVCADRRKSGQYLNVQRKQRGVPSNAYPVRFARDRPQRAQFPRCALSFTRLAELLPASTISSSAVFKPLSF